MAISPLPKLASPCPGACSSKRRAAFTVFVVANFLLAVLAAVFTLYGTVQTFGLDQLTVAYTDVKWRPSPFFRNDYNLLTNFISCHSEYEHTLRNKTAPGYVPIKYVAELDLAKCMAPRVPLFVNFATASLTSVIGSSFSIWGSLSGSPASVVMSVGWLAAGQAAQTVSLAKYMLTTGPVVSTVQHCNGLDTQTYDAVSKQYYCLTDNTGKHFDPVLVDWLARYNMALNGHILSLVSLFVAFITVAIGASGYRRDKTTGEGEPLLGAA